MESSRRGEIIQSDRVLASPGGKKVSSVKMAASIFKTSATPEQIGQTCPIGFMRQAEEGWKSEMGNHNDTIMQLYENNAVDWDRERGKGLFERAWLDSFLSLLPPGRSILDMGCGPGEPIARYLIDQGCKVTGVDSSPSFIEMCRLRFPGHDWLVEDMRSLSLDRRFDGILAWNSLFHLGHDEQRGMFPIFGRLAAPGAALMFTCGSSHGEAIGSYKGERVYHASLDEGEYRSLLERNGFSVVSHVVQDANCGDHTVWLALGR